jgi:hypothetical protein
MNADISSSLDVTPSRKVKSVNALFRFFCCSIVGVRGMIGMGGMPGYMPTHFLCESESLAERYIGVMLSLDHKALSFTSDCVHFTIILIHV